MSDRLEHWVDVTPSRNWIRADPNKNYGISTCRMIFYVRGPKGAVQWMIGTDWGIEPVRSHLEGIYGKNQFSEYDNPRQPRGWDLGYHAYEQQYEGQDCFRQECEVLRGKKCFYDGSGLNAELLIEGFLAGGTEWLWPKLEAYYAHVFSGAEWPDFSAKYLPHPDDEVTTDA